jgi:hypothetical protein
MLTLELISRKRKPVRRNAVFSIIGGILIIVFVGVAHRWLNTLIASSLMIIAGVVFMASLYNINYSTRGKIAIGSISFFEECIEIDLQGVKEIVNNDKIRSVRFKLSGYEGLNNSTLVDNIFWRPSLYSYHKGMNNFIYLHTQTGVRKYEFYIPDENVWLYIKKVAKIYYDKFRYPSFP